MADKTYAQLGTLGATADSDLVAWWPSGGPLQTSTRSDTITNFLTTALLLDGTHAMTAQLPGFAGTEGIPGFGFDGDGDTGMYRSAANTIGFSTGGLRRFGISATALTAYNGAAFVGALTGNADTATKLATGRTIAITGDLTYTSPSFDGSSNVTAAGTLATVNSNVGSFGDSTHVAQITVNGKGLITAASSVAISASSTDATVDAMLFGDGSDGDATISGSSTLTRDMYYNNLTIAAGAALNPGGFRIFVKGTLTLDSAPAGGIQANGSAGGNASVTTAGAQTTPAYFNTPLHWGIAGAAGVAGATGAGNNGTAGGSNAGVGLPLCPTSTNFSRGGNGGTTGSAGGTGGVAGSVNAQYAFRLLTPNLWGAGQGSDVAKILPYMAQAGAASGGGGAGDGTAGGGSGAGGNGGATVAIFARTISRGGSTATGAIQAKGGNGGSGGVPAAGNRGGGGGGGGGCGGIVFLVYRALSGSTASTAIDVTGGSGGAGGNGTGTGAGGDGGDGGPGGYVMAVNIATPAVTVTTNVARTSGNAHSGATGGAAKAATTSQVAI